MKVELPIPYGKQKIDSEDIDAVVGTLTSNYLTQGPKVKEFEEKFAIYTNANYATAVSNATAGLHLCVKALGLKPGDRVITTPITFAATANCVRYCGGHVWFADIDPDTFLISYEKTKALIESKPKGFFKGIIPVDFGGLSVDFEKFRSLADQHDLWLIEDACHAPGGYFYDSENQKNYTGSGKYADLSVFSFHPVKHIACGEGGMVTSNNEKLINKVQLLRTHGITKENLIQPDGDWCYEMVDLGFNYRLTDLQSALGISQLSKNEKGVETRNALALRYKRFFDEVGIKYQNTPKNFYHAYHLFVIQIDNRKELYNFLKDNDIFSQIHYIPIHKLHYYKTIGYEKADLIEAERYYNRCLSLPMYPSLETEQQDYILQKLSEYVNR